MIKQLDNGQWQVQSEKGKNLGTYDTEDQAKVRLKAVEMFKHMDRFDRKRRINEEITIEPFDEEKKDEINLSVDPLQYGFVTDPKEVFTNSKTDAWKNLNVKQYLILNNGEMIGSFATSIDPDNFEDYSLINFLIDKKYQGQGLGSKSIRKVIEFMRAEKPGKNLTLKVVPENILAKTLYEKNGFRFNGEDYGFTPPRLKFIYSSNIQESIKDGNKLFMPLINKMKG